jgi:hypothetical protein
MATRKMNRPIPRPNTTFKEKPEAVSFEDIGWKMPEELEEYAPLTKQIQTTATDATKLTGVYDTQEEQRITEQQYLKGKLIQDKRETQEQKKELWKPDKDINELMKERKEAQDDKQRERSLNIVHTFTISNKAILRINSMIPIASS